MNDNELKEAIAMFTAPGGIVEVSLENMGKAVQVIDQLVKRVEGLEQKLAVAREAVCWLQEQADQARGCLIERPCNKPKANIILLRMVQKRFFKAEDKKDPVEEAARKHMRNYFEKWWNEEALNTLNAEPKRSITINVLEAVNGYNADSVGGSSGS